MITIIGLGLLCVLASAMCVWAWLTGDPEQMTSEVPEHARWVGEGETTRLGQMPSSYRPRHGGE